MTRRIWRLLLAAAAGSLSLPALGGEWLPSKNLFPTLIAAPKEPRFSVSVRQYDAPSIDSLAYAFGAGEVLPLYQFEPSREGTRMQAGLDGGITGVLDVGSRSDALVNADYQIGARFSWSRSAWSGRFRLYHQSSHVGDDYLVYQGVRYREFNYESIEAIAAYTDAGTRWYLGGEYLFNHNPADLERTLVRTGYERFGVTRILGGVPFLAVDVRAWGERDWEPAVAGLTGLEFDNHISGRYVRLFFEGHTGYSPHGRFFVEDADWVGIGIQFGL